MLWMPDAFAVGELFPGYEAPAWLGPAVAQGTPEPIIAKLEAAAMEAFSDPGMKTTLANAGIVVTPVGRKAFTAKIASETAVWETTLANLGLLAK